MHGKEVIISATVMFHPLPPEAAAEEEEERSTNQCVQDIRQKVQKLKVHDIFRTEKKTTRKVMKQD